MSTLAVPVASSTGTTVVALDRISKSYESKVAVQDLSFQIQAGSMFGLLGPNGSGKTSSIRMMIGITMPDSGSVTLFGKPYERESLKRVGYLPEERGLYKKMKVIEQLIFIGRLRGLDPAVAGKRAHEWCERLQILDAVQKKTEELSKGMQQKIQFIVAVISDPPILILDEFSSGLDPVNANLLNEILLEERAKGKTILLSTHRMEEAERLCDHVCLINKGRKVLDGRLTDIRGRAGKSTVRVDYTGDAAVLRAAPGVTRSEYFGNYAELKLAPEAQSPENVSLLLRFLAPRLAITRFEQLEPSLNQIFLDTVAATTPAQSLAVSN